MAPKPTCERVEKTWVFVFSQTTGLEAGHVGIDIPDIDPVCAIPGTATAKNAAAVTTLLSTLMATFFLVMLGAIARTFLRVPRDRAS